MDFKNYEKLNTKVGKKSFYEEFSIVNTSLTWFSYLGNIISIFFAFVFFGVMASSAFSGWQLYLAYITIVGILTFIEFAKRTSFYQFVLNIFRKHKLINVKSIIGIVFTTILVSISFYSSMNGAMDMFDKEEIVQELVTEKQDSIKNSITVEYDELISELKKERERLIEEIDHRKYLVKIKGYEQVSDRKILIDFEEGLSKLNEDINIKLSERDLKLKEIDNLYLAEENTVVTQIENNQLKFFIFSLFIEICILLGSGFGAYYFYRSKQEHDAFLENHHNYEKYNDYIGFYRNITKNFTLNKGDKIKDFKTKISNNRNRKNQQNMTINNKSATLFTKLGIVKDNNDNTFTLTCDPDKGKEEIYNYFF